MAVENGEMNTDVANLTRAEAFESAAGTLATAHQAVGDALAVYDSAMSDYIRDTSEALTGATIIVSSADILQHRILEHPLGDEWEQTNEPITQPTDMVVSRITGWNRRDKDAPSPLPELWAEAAIISGGEEPRQVRFWLHNAEWSFKPITPEASAS